MASRLKEDEKNEKIIRGLLKLPENRRCINCNSLGPQYVCTNFWTFICTTCSGIHREFTHRVKSISMAKFTSQEVSALQNGGNEHAKGIFMKEWDPQRHSLPDGSNIERLRDFIKHVYVDRRYMGDRNSDRPPRAKMGDRVEGSGDIKKLETSRGGSRSPPFGDKYENRFSERSKYVYDERKSPGYDPEYRRSPRHFEIVDGRVRDDRFGNAPKNKCFEDRHILDGTQQFEGRSPNRPKVLDFPSPPVVRPVREILGENVPPLQVGEPTKSNGRRTSNDSFDTQRTASSSSLTSVDGNPVELRTVNSESLIDFNVDPQPAVSATSANDLLLSKPVQQQMSSAPSSGGNNWANFAVPEHEKALKTTGAVASVLESQLSQLSMSAIPVGRTAQHSPENLTNTIQATFSQFSAPVSSRAMELSSSFVPDKPQTQLQPQLQQPQLQVQHLGQQNPLARQLSLSSLQGTSQFQSQQPQLLAQLSQQPQLQAQLTQQLYQHQQQELHSQPQPQKSLSFTGPPVIKHPNLEISHAPNAEVPTSVSGHVSQAPKQTEEIIGRPLLRLPTHADMNSSGRKELPENLFSANQPHASSPVQLWQTATPYVSGYGMPYHIGMPTYMQQSKSTNPFDLSSESLPVRGSLFPSMAPLQRVLPSMAAQSGSLHITSTGASSQWMGPQSPLYQSALPSGYVGQQAQSSTLPQGFDAGAVSGTIMIRAQSAGFSQQSAANYSLEGNPFG